MNEYPSFQSGNAKDIENLLFHILRERKTDVKDFNNLQSSFISGRKVAKIPTGSSDVTVTDRVGDFNVTATYAYFLINNAGTPQWRRVSLSSW